MQLHGAAGRVMNPIPEPFPCVLPARLCQSSRGFQTQMQHQACHPSLWGGSRTSCRRQTAQLPPISAQESKGGALQAKPFTVTSSPGSFPPS